MTPLVYLIFSVIQDALQRTPDKKVVTAIIDKVTWHKLLKELYINPLFITCFQAPLPGEPLKIEQFEYTLLVYSSSEMATGLIRIFDLSIADIHHNL